MCGFIHTLPTLWGWAFRRLRRLLRTNAYAAMHKMACFESAAIVSECEKMMQGGRTVCYWYTKYPPGSLSASTVGGRRVCSQLPSHSVCGHSTIVACGSFNNRRRRLYRRRRLLNDPHTPCDNCRMTAHTATAVGCTHNGCQELKQIANLAVILYTNSIRSRASDFPRSRKSRGIRGITDLKRNS